MNPAMLEEKLLSIGFGAVKRELTDRPAITVPVTELVGAMQVLRDDAELQFTFLLTHAAIDWIEEDRFELVYQLFSPVLNHYCLVATNVSRGAPVAPTLGEIWPIAHWQEREVYDLFGVIYTGHTDLRRLFLEDDWVGYPLRRDYQDGFMIERPE